jgi:hypothetical protein
MANVSPDQFRKIAAAAQSIVGRMSGPELFFSQNVALTSGGGPLIVQVPRTLNINRPISDIWIELRYRLAVTVAAYTAVAPEGTQNLLQQIQVQGQHKDFGNITPIKMTGATAFMWPRLFQARGNGWNEDNGRYQAESVSAAPGGAVASGNSAMANGFKPFSNVFSGEVANHDIITVWRIPVYPIIGSGQSAKRNALNFIWSELDWADTLQIQLTFGDSSALGDPTGATRAFTAFGSAAGSPLLNIHLGYTLLGEMEPLVRRGVVIRTEQPVSNPLTSLTTSAILQTLQKNITTNVLVKTGAIQTAGLTGGVDTLASLSDVQLDKTQIIVDNKPLRNNQSNIVTKAHQQAYWNTDHPQGYFVHSFLEGHNPLLAYRGDSLGGGSQFQLQTDCLVASANNRQRFVQEQILGGPFPNVR